MKKLLVVLILLVCFGFGMLPITDPALAENAKVKLGVQPWLGYGPWWIAEKNGYFEKRGLDVKVINFTWDQDMGAALAAGQLLGQAFESETQRHTCWMPLMKPMPSWRRIP